MVFSLHNELVKYSMSFSTENQTAISEEIMSVFNELNLISGTPVNEKAESDCGSSATSVTFPMDRKNSFALQEMQNIDERRFSFDVPPDFAIELPGTIFEASPPPPLFSNPSESDPEAMSSEENVIKPTETLPEQNVMISEENDIKTNETVPEQNHTEKKLQTPTDQQSDESQPEVTLLGADEAAEEEGYDLTDRFSDSEGEKNEEESSNNSEEEDQDPQVNMNFGNNVLEEDVPNTENFEENEEDDVEPTEYSQKMNMFYSDEKTDRNDVCDINLNPRAFKLREVLFREIIDIREDHAKVTDNQNHLIEIWNAQEEAVPNYFLRRLITPEDRQSHHWMGRYSWYMSKWMKSDASSVHPSPSALMSLQQRALGDTPVFFNPMVGSISSFKRFKLKHNAFGTRSKSADSFKSMNLDQLSASSINGSIVQNKRIWNEQQDVRNVFFPSREAMGKPQPNSIHQLGNFNSKLTAEKRPATSFNVDDESSLEFSDDEEAGEYF